MQCKFYIRHWAIKTRATTAPASTSETIKSRISVQDLPKIVYPFRRRSTRRTHRVPLADKYAGHETCFGNDICFRIECSLLHCTETPFSVPFSNSRLLVLNPPLNSPYMIHEAHSSAIRWHDTHPTTVPWNHAPWSRALRPRYMPSPSTVWITLLCDTYNSASSTHCQIQSFYLMPSAKKLSNVT